jgi:hypothetical protein
MLVLLAVTSESVLTVKFLNSRVPMPLLADAPISAFPFFSPDTDLGS